MCVCVGGRGQGCRVASNLFHSIQNSCISDIIPFIPPFNPAACSVYNRPSSRSGAFLGGWLLWRFFLGSEVFLTLCGVGAVLCGLKNSGCSVIPAENIAQKKCYAFAPQRNTAVPCKPFASPARLMCPDLGVLDGCGVCVWSFIC